MGPKDDLQPFKPLSNQEAKWPFLQMCVPLLGRLGCLNIHGFHLLASI